ncbi:MAG: GNAT family N-acetyltransferase [Sneathiella sp.]
MRYSAAYFDTPVAAELLSQLHGLCFSKGWDEKAFSELLQLSGTTAHIISLAETPCAFCLFQIVGEDAEILTLGVIPEARGDSVGHFMLSQGVGPLIKAGVHRLFLEVSETNVSALKLYENFGFIKVGLRKNYYKEGDSRAHAIVMEKPLI